ncbi:MAG: ECF-type sigma factor [Blastocatellia bacterium]
MRSWRSASSGWSGRRFRKFCPINGLALSLDEALRRLTEINPRRSRVVELRFFGGLTGAETAAALGVSEGTVERDWNLARTWLYKELYAGGELSLVSDQTVSRDHSTDSIRRRFVASPPGAA